MSDTFGNRARLRVAWQEGNAMTMERAIAFAEQDVAD